MTADSKSKESENVLGDVGSGSGAVGRQPPVGSPL